MPRQFNGCSFAGGKHGGRELWPVSRSLVFLCSIFLMLSGIVLGNDESAERRNISELGEHRLRDHANREHDIQEFVVGDNWTLLAFVGTECPVARLYIPKLVEFAEQPDVRVVGLASNYQDDLTELAALVREFDLPFPVLRDHDAVVAEHFGVTRTPEVVLLDASGSCRYRGRIDDQFVIGARRDAAIQTPLEDAFEALRAGTAVAVESTEPVGCLIGRRPRANADSSVTYHEQIAPIIHAHCAECHREGQIGPFSLTEYSDVAAWADMLQETIHAGRMPPWLANPKHGDFRNDPRLSAVEKSLFDEWVANGCPEGSPEAAAELPQFTEGWRIEQPDVVVEMATEPFTVPASGTVKYQYFAVDPQFTEDKYLVAAEPKPGNPAVVHHIIVHVVRPGSRRIQGIGIAIGYAPGMPPFKLPNGLAMKIPKGAGLVFEMHYTPNGTETTDLSRVGLKFVPKESVHQLVGSGAIVNDRFEIPPKTSDYRVQAVDVIKRDCWLITMTPHMHFRGAAFRYAATYPSGEEEILLDVPRYDFNWQLRYELESPKWLPAGTKLRGVALYDNSEANPANPDPNASVRWGEQSWEEMMIGFYTTIPHRLPVEAPQGESGPISSAMSINR